MKQILLTLFLFILIISSVSALRITGESVKISIPFEPNYNLTKEFKVSNNDGFLAHYDIYPIHVKGADLRQYFKVIPARMENVNHGDGRDFQIQLTLPEKIDHPGISETWVKVKATKPGATGIIAVPSLAIRYIFFVLYPWPYVEWGLNAPHMNIDETTDITIKLNNLGEPTINSAKADIEIIELRNNKTITTLKTNTKTNILKRQQPELKTTFSSNGLKSGNYRAIATLYWDKNISTRQKDFKVGSINIDINDYTKLFEIDSINLFKLNLTSGWNDELKNVYAKFYVYDKDTNEELKSFKSLNIDLLPWETKLIDAYFDTSGLEKKEYNLLIELNFAGNIKKEEGIIKIDENINAVIVDEIPGPFSNMNLSGVFTMYNMMLLLLIIFVMTLSMGIIMMKSKNEKQIDPNVVNHVKKIRLQYNDEYIKVIMMKKGWDPKLIDKIIKKARK